MTLAAGRGTGAVAAGGRAFLNSTAVDGLAPEMGGFGGFAGTALAFPAKGVFLADGFAFNLAGAGLFLLLAGAGLRLDVMTETQKNRLNTSLWAAAQESLWAVGVILAISGPVASAEAASCPKKSPEMVNFQGLPEPRPVPTEAFFDAGDAPRRLSDYRGTGLVVNFWATWCAPCVKEMPELDRLAASLNHERIEVLTISADIGGAPVVEKFMAANGLKNLPVLIDKKTRLIRALGLKGLPTTLLIDRDGFEVARVVGAEKWDGPAARALIKACIGSGVIPARAGG